MTKISSSLPFLDNSKSPSIEKNKTVGWFGSKKVKALFLVGLAAFGGLAIKKFFLDTKENEPSSVSSLAKKGDCREAFSLMNWQMENNETISQISANDFSEYCESSVRMTLNEYDWLTNSSVSSLIGQNKYAEAYAKATIIPIQQIRKLAMSRIFGNWNDTERLNQFSELIEDQNDRDAQGEITAQLEKLGDDNGAIRAFYRSLTSPSSIRAASILSSYLEGKLACYVRLVNLKEYQTALEVAFLIDNVKVRENVILEVIGYALAEDRLTDEMVEMICRPSDLSRDTAEKIINKLSSSKKHNEAIKIQAAFTNDPIILKQLVQKVEDRDLKLHLFKQIAANRWSLALSIPDILKDQEIVDYFIKNCGDLKLIEAKFPTLEQQTAMIERLVVLKAYDKLIFMAIAMTAEETKIKAYQALIDAGETYSLTKLAEENGLDDTQRKSVVKRLIQLDLEQASMAAAHLRDTNSQKDAFAEILTQLVETNNLSARWAFISKCSHSDLLVKLRERTGDFFTRMMIIQILSDNKDYKAISELVGKLGPNEIQLITAYFKYQLKL